MSALIQLAQMKIQLALVQKQLAFWTQLGTVVCPSPGSALPLLMAKQMLRLLILIAYPIQHVCEVLVGASVSIGPS